MTKSMIPEESRKEKDQKKKDHASISRKYYTIPEDALQLIIKKAKAGNTRSQEELLIIFDNFLKKYVALLMHKKCDLRDYDIRRFVALFVKGSHSQKIRRNQIDSNTYKVVNETLRGLHYMINRYGELSDVEQTVHVTFFECLNRYERKDSIPFSGFLYNYFFYKLQKNVEEFLISQLGRKTFGLYIEDSVSSSYSPSDNIDLSSINSEVQRQITVNESEVYTLGTDKIDEFWIASETASYPFDQLTINQRQLLKWRFIDGLRAPSIAEKTSEHPNTCRAQLHKIREDLEAILGDELSDYINFDLLEIDS